jgi:hypothetical protein
MRTASTMLPAFGSFDAGYRTACLQSPHGHGDNALGLCRDCTGIGGHKEAPREIGCAAAPNAIENNAAELLQQA